MITLDQVKIIREGRKKKFNNPDHGDLLNESDDKKNKNKKKGRSAERQRDATGGKTTGSLKKGNLSFPGDRSGAYNVTKADIAARQGLKDAGASGDFSPTMPTDKRKKGQAKRDARTKQLDIPDPFTTPSSKKPIRPFGDKPVTTGIDKSVTPKINTAGINPYAQGDPLMGKGDYNDLPSKPPVTRYNPTEPFQDDDLGQRTGKTGDKLKYKQPTRLQPAKTTKRGIPQKARVQSQKPVSGIYRGSSVGKRELGLALSSGEKFAKKAKEKLKKQKINQYSPSSFRDEITGRTFNMANPADKAKYLKQQGKTYTSKKELYGQPFRKASGSSSKTPPSGGSSKGYSDLATAVNNVSTKKSLFSRVKSAGKKALKASAKTALRRPVGSLAALALLGYAGNELRKRVFAPKRLGRGDYKAKEIKLASGKSINPNSQNKLDRELLDVTRTTISPEVLKNMGPGGRYQRSSTYDFIKSPKYKKEVAQNMKKFNYKKIYDDKGKFKNYQGDPYNVSNKKP